MARPSNAPFAICLPLLGRRHEWEPLLIPLIEQHRATVEALCRTHHVRRLELFGSAVTGKHHPATSDLDFLVEFDALPCGDYANAYFALREDLERVLGCPIDLVVDAAIRNPYFRKAVDQTRSLLYAA